MQQHWLGGFPAWSKPNTRDISLIYCELHPFVLLLKIFQPSSPPSKICCPTTKKHQFLMSNTILIILTQNDHHQSFLCILLSPPTITIVKKRTHHVFLTFAPKHPTRIHSHNYPWIQIALTQWNKIIMLSKYPSTDAHLINFFLCVGIGKKHKNDSSCHNTNNIIIKQQKHQHQPTMPNRTSDMSSHHNSYLSKTTAKHDCIDEPPTTQHQLDNDQKKCPTRPIKHIKLSQ